MMLMSADLERRTHCTPYLCTYGFQNLHIQADAMVLANGKKKNEMQCRKTKDLETKKGGYELEELHFTVTANNFLI